MSAGLVPAGFGHTWGLFQLIAQSGGAAPGYGDRFTRFAGLPLMGVTRGTQASLPVPSCDRKQTGWKPVSPFSPNMKSCSLKLPPILRQSVADCREILW